MTEITRTGEPLIELTGVSKSFGTNQVIHHLSMKIYRGEFLTILGSSGCGKTTVLRMIGGFETPTGGEIRLNGASIAGKKPYEIHVNTVFQSYALFPHMNVFDNVAYGLKLKGMQRAKIKEKVKQMLGVVQLSGFESRKINQLSGGQRQRVAIARALVNDPEVLLLDESLSALDMQLRKQMQVELKRLQRKFGITFIFVTHDQEEAMTMSDRIAVMNAGYLEQIGTPEEIYEKPETRFVADFIGETNSFSCVVKEIGDHNAVVSLENGTALVEKDGLKPFEMFYLSVRPQYTHFSRKPVRGFTIKAIAREVIYIGTIYKVNLEMSNGHEVKIHLEAKDDVPRSGEMVYVWWDPSDAVVVHDRDNKVFEIVDQMNLTEERRVAIHEEKP
ncbi:MAG: ABC transporter ATP-binding protein [Bilifractor sp.]|jgi:spermidine/putrescine transport system ATP-binding protein